MDADARPCVLVAALNTTRQLAVRVKVLHVYISELLRQCTDVPKARAKSHESAVMSSGEREHVLVPIEPPGQRAHKRVLPILEEMHRVVGVWRCAHS